MRDSHTVHREEEATSVYGYTGTLGANSQVELGWEGVAAALRSGLHYAARGGHVQPRPQIGKGLPDIARHVIGCPSTQGTTAQTR